MAAMWITVYMVFYGALSVACVGSLIFMAWRIFGEYFIKRS